MNSLLALLLASAAALASPFVAAVIYDRAADLGWRLFGPKD